MAVVDDFVVIVLSVFVDFCFEASVDADGDTDVGGFNDQVATNDEDFSRGGSNRVLVGHYYYYLELVLNITFR